MGTAVYGKINSAMAKARPERNEIRRIRFSLRSVMDGCCLSKFKLLFLREVKPCGQDTAVDSIQYYI